jgi:hypothetical protein
LCLRPKQKEFLVSMVNLLHIHLYWEPPPLCAYEGSPQVDRDRGVSPI